MIERETNRERERGGETEMEWKSKWYNQTLAGPLLNAMLSKTYTNKEKKAKKKYEKTAPNQWSIDTIESNEGNCMLINSLIPEIQFVS